MNTLELPKIAMSKMQARFPDCDPYHHLNNSKYIDYIINAREDQLKEFYDIDIHKLIRSIGLGWVVAQNQIAYLLPVDLMEVICIQTRLLDYNSKSILLEAVVYDEHVKNIKAVMWSKQVHYNIQTKRSHAHSEEFIEFFKATHYPLEKNLTFEERVAELKERKG